MGARTISLRAVVLSLACLMFVGFVARAQAEQGSAVVKALRGRVSSMDALGFTRLLKLGDVLKPGETVTTGPDSTVDLFLDQIGRGLELAPNSMLSLEKMTRETSAIGTVTDTRVELQKGGVYGVVLGLRPGSQFEVKTPQGLTSVKSGTSEFFIDALQGTVYVTLGTVQLHLVLNLAGGPLTRDVTINAGPSGPGLFISIPPHLTESEFSTLSPAPLTMKNNRTQLLRLAGLGTLTRYRDTSTDLRGVAETFNATESGTTLTITKPPTSSVVSP